MYRYLDLSRIKHCTLGEPIAHSAPNSYSMNTVVIFDNLTLLLYFTTVKMYDKRSSRIFVVLYHESTHHLSALVSSSSSKTAQAVPSGSYMNCMKW